MIRASEINKNNSYLEQALSVASQKTDERREEMIEYGEGRYSYRATLATTQKVNWRIEDIIGGDKQLDFSKPFMPESLARVEPLDFLRADEKRKLNQIRANAYLGIFGLVEEFILPFVLDHARPQLHGDDYRVRALLQFASEEAKHIHLFKRFREEFERGFGHDCAMVGPPEAIAQAVLAHDPLAVALTILHIWSRRWPKGAAPARSKQRSTSTSRLAAL